MITTTNPGPSLNETLATHGFTTKRVQDYWTSGQKHIMWEGKVVFTGTSTDVWAWLRSTHVIK